MPGARDLWPTPSTQQLLRAGLLRGDAGRASWEAWLATGPPADPKAWTSAERRLLPLVATNLAREGIQHPLVDEGLAMAGRTRGRNERLLELAARALGLLRDAGVPVMVLKGVPLLLEHFHDLSLRPMSDVDLMIHPEHLEAALAALHERGFLVEDIPPALRPYLCAIEVRRAEGNGAAELDLHQYLIEYGSSAETERGLWERGHELDVGGVIARAPSPTDLLLHVCVASMKAGRERNSRWVVDCYWILERSAATIDWELLVRETARRRMALAVREALDFLVEVAPVNVPASARAALAAIPVGAAERRTYQALTRGHHSLPQLVGEHVVQYRFGARAAGERASALGLLRFSALLLQKRWHLASPWQLPRTAVVRLWRRLRAGEH